MLGLECIQKSYSAPLSTFVILLAKGLDHVKHLITMLLLVRQFLSS